MKRFYRLPEKRHYIVTSWYKSSLFYKETLLFVNWKICSGSVNIPWRNQKQDLSFRSFAYLMSLAAYIIAARCFIVLPSWFLYLLAFGSRENIPPNSDFVFLMVLLPVFGCLWKLCEEEQWVMDLWLYTYDTSLHLQIFLIKLLKEKFAILWGDIRSYY